MSAAPVARLGGIQADPSSDDTQPDLEKLKPQDRLINLPVAD